MFTCFDLPVLIPVKMSQPTKRLGQSDQPLYNAEDENDYIEQGDSDKDSQASDSRVASETVCN